MKRITLCGSTKFKREYEALNRQLSLEGNVVYSVAFFAHADNITLTKEQKETLDKVHKAKIDNSDAILVIDVDGYIGDSTQSEIDYAYDKKKTVKYLSNFPDLVYLCDCVTIGKALSRKIKENNYDKEDNLIGMSVWDWIVTKSGKIRQITSDDMNDLHYSEIARYATEEEIKNTK